MPKSHEIGLIVIFKKHQCIFTILLIISLWKRLTPSFEQSWIRFTKGCLVLSLVEIFSVVLEEEMKISSMNFPYFDIISPWRREWPFVWIDFTPLHPRMPCQVWWTLFHWYQRRNLFEWTEALEQTCSSQTLTLPYNCYWVCSSLWPYLITAMRLFHSLTLSSISFQLASASFSLWTFFMIIFLSGKLCSGTNLISCLNTQKT